MIAEQGRALSQNSARVAAAGIVVAPYHSLSAEERSRLDDLISREMFFRCYAAGVDPASVSIHLGLSLNLGVNGPTGGRSTNAAEWAALRSFEGPSGLTGPGCRWPKRNLYFSVR